MTGFEWFFTVLLVLNGSILLLVVWNVLSWPEPAENVNRRDGSCSVLIPARNEEATVASCIESVLQQGDEVMEIIVCDDHSSDATAAIVREFEKRDPRIRLIKAPPLPSGWCGKNFACATLGHTAAGTWLLFLDADSRLCTGAIVRMLWEAEKRRVSFLSCWPGLELKGFWEKTLMPMLNFVVFTIFPAPLSLKKQYASLGLAHGACILARREEYQAIGGHEVVRDEIFEDTSLARLWRAKNQRGICLDGQSIVRVRMYNSLRGIWNGFKKNFFPSFRRPRSFWLFLLLHFLCFLLPFVLFVAGAVYGVWILPAAFSVTAVFLMRTILAARFGHPLWSVALHPLSEIILLTLGIVSWQNCRRGRGVEWKGRIYRDGMRTGERNIV